MLRDELTTFVAGFREVDLELALLLDGGKQILKKDWQSRASSEALVSLYGRKGLEVEVVGDKDDARVDPGTGLKKRSPLTRFVLASRDRGTLDEAVELALVEMDPSGDSDRRSRARQRLGLLLGYPPCCCTFYSDFEARDDEEAFYGAYRGTDGVVSGFNLFTGLHTISVLSHAPCSFSCAPSHELTERVLGLFRQASPEGYQAYMALSRRPLLYMGEPRRFLLDGEAGRNGDIRYRDVRPAHFVNRKGATDPDVLRHLRAGDRLRLTADGLTVWKGRRRVWSLDLRTAVRPPLLLAPGQRLSNHRVRTGLVETTFPGRHDLFGNMRLSLLAGDLKTNGHIVRSYAVEPGGDGLDGPACEALAQDLAGQRTDAVVFYRFAPPELLEPLRRSLPGARLLLAESGTPFGGAPSMELVDMGRLPILRLIDALSHGGDAAPTVEPALYVPPDQPFAPDLQRRRVRPRLDSPGTLEHWEVLGRLACPYRRNVRSNPCFEGLDLDEETVFTRGCSLCSFRTRGPTRVSEDEWVDGLCRQVAWIRGRDGEADHFRIVDHRGLQFLEPLLDRLEREGWTGFTLLLDARVDHLLARNTDWKSITAKARATGTHLDFACVGFESFSQAELDRFNKGVTVERNVAAVRKLRKLRSRAPDVFVHEHEGAGFVTWTPWTTLDDLRRNVHWFRELDFGEIRTSLASLRVRLYPDLPLYHLARRDGLLLDSRPPEWETPSGYSPDHPWRFRSEDTARAFALVQRLQREVSERGHDVEILDLVVRVMARLGRAPSTVTADPGPGAHPRDGGSAPVIPSFVDAMVKGLPSKDRFRLAADHMVGWRRPARVHIGEDLGDQGRVLRVGCLYPVTGKDQVRAWLDTVNTIEGHLGLDRRTGPERTDPVDALLERASTTLTQAGLEIVQPLDGGNPSLRLTGVLSREPGDVARRVLQAAGIDGFAFPAGSLARLLVRLTLDLGRPGRVGVGLSMGLEHKRPSVMAQVVTTPPGPRLYDESDSMELALDAARPGRGRFLFHLPSGEAVQAMAGVLGARSPGLVEALRHMTDPPDTGPGPTAPPVPEWIGMAFNDGKLDPTHWSLLFRL